MSIDVSITTLAHLWIFLYKYETIYYKQRNVCGTNPEVESFLNYEYVRSSGISLKLFNILSDIFYYTFKIEP